MTIRLNSVRRGASPAVRATLNARWMSNRTRVRPRFASKNDPTDGAETGGAEPQIAERSRSWRAAIGKREIMRGS
jgi:hypothetical protein